MWDDKGMKMFINKCKLTKLFAKHIKLEEQVHGHHFDQSKLSWFLSHLLLN